MNRQQAELQLIAHEGWRLRQLILDEDLVGRGVLGSLLLPSLAFFVVEASKWYKEQDLIGASSLLGEYDSAFRQVRARLKLLDDKQLRTIGIQKLLDQCDEVSIEYFNRNHTGITERIKRLLQRDIGLFFVGSDFICSTNLMFMYMVQANPKMPRPTQDIFAQTGPPEYSIQMGRFLDVLTQPVSNFVRISDLPYPTYVYETGLYYRDVKSKELYRQIHGYLGLPTNLIASYFVIISQVNFVHRWLRHVLPENDPLLFRVRYLTAYHSLSGLKKLNAATQGNKNLKITQICSSLLNNTSAVELRKYPKSLRNLLAHYEVHDDAIGRAGSVVDFLADSARIVSGREYQRISEKVDDVLEGISIGFNDVIRPGILAVRM